LSLFPTNCRDVTILLFAASVLLCLPSCGGPARTPNRIPLEGRIVTATGKPVNGSISFTPAKGTKGLAATSSIVEGNYRFTTSDGPQAGKYNVTVILNATAVPASKKTAPAKSQDRESFDADLSATRLRLDHTLKLK